MGHVTLTSSAST
ncbi:hypothetical protein Tsp_14106, partial [Trichinella spiralis]